MVRRRKTKLEKLLSFNQHKKRFGAGDLQKGLEQIDYETLKETIILGDEICYTHGSDKSIETHFEELRKEFVGASELLYYHAKLIVLIRREANLKKNIQLFEKLWKNEISFLIDNLNTRWLVAAADTFVDHTHNAENKAYAMACSCLINTIKLNETERFLQRLENNKDIEQRHQQLTQERVALFDGVSAFSVGTDDTLRNMKWRLDSISSQSPCYKILQEIFRRLQEENTVYKRFRDRHTRKKTAWW